MDYRRQDGKLELTPSGALKNKITDDKGIEDIEATESDFVSRLVDYTEQGVQEELLSIKTQLDDAADKISSEADQVVGYLLKKFQERLSNGRKEREMLLERKIVEAIEDETASIREATSKRQAAGLFKDGESVEQYWKRISGGK